MKKLKQIITLTFLMTSLVANAQTGYLGKSVMLSTDLYRMVMDGSINADLNFLIRPNLNIVTSVGLVNYASKEAKMTIYNNDVYYAGLKGYSIDIKLLANSYYTGQIAPLGHFYGYGIGYSGLNKLASSTQLSTSAKVLENPFHLFDINLFYGKSFLISQNLFLSFDLSLSLLISYQANRDSYELLARMPRKFIPLYSGYGNDEIVNESNFQTGMFFKPSLKLSYFVF